jgi:phosphoribosylglycinamide formyltransferase 1
VRLVVLISGRGSNLAALLKAAEAPDFPARVVLVASNRPGAGGLALAQAAGVETVVVDHKSFGADREAFERALDAALKKAEPDLVVCAGFMRVLTPFFVRTWKGRLINIHPALLPSFKGLDTHARALAAGAAIHGCTVHWVDEGVDEGAIIGQAAVRVVPGDTPETLAARVLEAEHRLLPACVAALARGQTGPIALL